MATTECGGKSSKPQGFEIDIELQGMDQIMKHLDDMDCRSRYALEVGIIKKQRYPGRENLYVAPVAVFRQM